MKSVVELDIDAPQSRVAELFTDPRRNPEWMDDVERIEPLAGDLGQPGSTYRIVPKTGKLNFVARIISRQLPGEARLLLDDPSVSVSVAARFSPLSGGRTRLTSEEIFSFKGIFGPLAGVFARGAIKRAHRQHMESFKRFVERQP